MSNLPYRFPEAYQSGMDACIAADGDASKADNPYPLPGPAVWACYGGNEWHAWNRGWNDTRPYTSDWPPKGSRAALKSAWDGDKTAGELP